MLTETAAQVLLQSTRSFSCTYFSYYYCAPGMRMHVLGYLVCNQKELDHDSTDVKCPFHPLTPRCHPAPISLSPLSPPLSATLIHRLSKIRLGRFGAPRPNIFTVPATVLHAMRPPTRSVRWLHGRRRHRPRHRIMTMKSRVRKSCAPTRRNDDGVALLPRR